MIKDRFLWIVLTFFCIAFIAILFSPFEARSYDRLYDSPLQNKVEKGAYPPPPTPYPIKQKQIVAPASAVGSYRQCQLVDF